MKNKTLFRATTLLLFMVANPAWSQIAENPQTQTPVTAKMHHPKHKLHSAKHNTNTENDPNSNNATNGQSNTLTGPGVNENMTKQQGYR